MVLNPKLNTSFHHNLDKVSKKEVKDLKTLPLSHNCCVSELETIISTDKIESKYQEHLKENLSFFFYGKPSFYNTEWYQPVCLLFQADETLQFRGIAPFDTGGFENFYKPKLKSGNLVISQFIKNDDVIGLDYPKKIILKFFNSSNLDYLKNKINYSGDIKDLNTAGSYYNTLSKFPGAGDERKFTIELQVSTSFSIKNNKLLFAYLPLSVNHDVEDYLKDLNPELDIGYYEPGGLFLNEGLIKIMADAKNEIIAFLKDGDYL